MNPPIPEPIIAPRELNRGPRPEALKLFIAGALVFTVAGFLYCDGTLTSHSIAADVALYSVFAAIWLVLLWFLWKGHNWARVTVMVWCALSVVSVLAIGEDTMLQKFLTIADAVFSAVWFWWLRAPAIVAFSKGKPV